jgi:hypothetical protein
MCGNRERERIKNIKICWPHVPPRDGRVVERIQVPYGSHYLVTAHPLTYYPNVTDMSHMLARVSQF